MIEKLNEYKITNRDGNFINVECNTKIINTMVRKINELVDAVNELKTKAEITEECLHPTAKVDHYAEQRKWIGHLVEYGNADDGFKYGILTNIEPIYNSYPFEIDNGRDATADCWLPDESVFYKKD